MNAPGLSVVAIGSPIRVVRFHESLSSSRLVLLDLLLGVALSLSVNLDVAILTHQHDVVRVVTSGLHTVRTFNGVRTLDGSDVVAVQLLRQATSHDAFLHAHLTASVGSLPHDCLHRLPPLRVQQLLVSWVSAHGSPFFCEGSET